MSKNGIKLLHISLIVFLKFCGLLFSLLWKEISNTCNWLQIVSKDLSDHVCSHKDLDKDASPH